MPISESALKRLRESSATQLGSKVVLRVGDSSPVVAAIVRFRSGGVLLALPAEVDVAVLNTVEEGVFGSFVELATRFESELEELEGELCLVDCELAVHKYLDTFNPKEVNLKWFLGEGIWPSGPSLYSDAKRALTKTDVVEMERGEEFFSVDEDAPLLPGERTPERGHASSGSKDGGKAMIEAMAAMLDERLNPLTKRLDTLEAGRKKPPTAPSRLEAEAGREEVAKLIPGPPSRMKTSSTPKRDDRQEEPGRTGKGKEYEDDDDVEELDTQSMMKLLLTKMLKDEHAQRKKTKKRIPGLQVLSEEEGDETEDVTLDEVKSGKGARGLEDGARLRHSMKVHDREFLDRFRENLVKATDSLVYNPEAIRQFVKTMPVGEHKVLGFFTQAVSEVAVRLAEGKPIAAELLCLQSLAAIETYSLEMKWEAAWRITGLKMPPTAAWQTINVKTVRQEWESSRLIEAGWQSVYLQELRDLEFLMKRRALGKGKGDGKEKDKKEE
eukprot:TRINITY_DN9685_c0_g1_i1.p2 TRINITY_DN9685_c0_g1~~TRINITY_DN9685_c0_g1_i1.p2  ORF type:complete len:498 (-),score=100.49 TRINITY_DN9685_c0_g1_i1:311-1804(-)